VTRGEDLERHGRAYGALRLAVAFTAGLEGDDAKRVTVRGWDRTPRLVDPEQGAAILRARGERRNPATVLRPSGLIGIDIDGADGVGLVRRLVPEGLPRTVAVETGAEASYHLYFLAPVGARSAFVELGPEGVTTKTNQYLVAPPAFHPFGRIYRFANGRAPWEIALAHLPLALLERFERAARGERARRAAAAGPIAAGGRHDHLMRLGCAMRRRGAGEATIVAALLVENRDRCAPPKDEELVLGLARDITNRYPPGAAS
jgi:putative DNA primase/helicase